MIPSLTICLTCGTLILLFEPLLTRLAVSVRPQDQTHGRDEGVSDQRRDRTPADQRQEEMGPASHLHEL